jgi:hypothetical protein
MPFQPGGVRELPASRVVLLADDQNRVRAIDERTVRRLDQKVESSWESPSLNRKDMDREYTFTRLVLLYSADETSTFEVEVTGDGSNYSSPETLTVEDTEGRLKRVVIGPNVSGFDLRFRVLMEEDEIINIHEYTARMVERSEIVRV